MTRTELLELLKNGANSGVEFKRDDVHPESLAKEMSALLNLEGGHILRRGRRWNRHGTEPPSQRCRTI